MLSSRAGNELLLLEFELAQFNWLIFNSVQSSTQVRHELFLLVSQRALRGRARARLTGALSKGGKMRGVATNVYLGKRWENQRKPVKMKILSLGVVFTLKEGISTSHVCLKGQQPIF